MKLFALLAVAVLSAAASLRADPPTPPADGPHCAFADERFMTITNVVVFAADHYLAHHRWPRSRAELRVQALRKNTRQETDEFFARFSRLDLRRQGRDLRLDLRFRDAGPQSRQSVLLHPGGSVERIFQAATEPLST